MTRKILFGLCLLLVFALGVGLTRYYYTNYETRSEEASQVLLERIKAVAKLVTVEGYFSEVYDYKDYWGYDLGPFRKKALIRVKAKVSAGYDLGTMKIETVREEKKVVISHLPDPTIISIDHELDYYDITEGTFNTFSARDLSVLNEKAKNYIRQQAESSDILLAAEEQGNQVLDMIRFIVESAGWRLEYKTRVGTQSENSSPLQ